MSDLNDPRVLFAAERTLLAWNRTATGLLALGFLIDRGSLLAQAGRVLGLGIGLAFIVLGIALNLVSVLQYRRGLESLRPAEIPARYWPNLAVVTSLAVALLGLLLALYMLVA